MRGGWVEVVCPNCGTRGRARLAKAREAVKCNECRTLIQWTGPGKFRKLDAFIRKETEPAPPPTVRLLPLRRLATIGAGVGAVVGVLVALALGWLG